MTAVATTARWTDADRAVNPWWRRPCPNTRSHIHRYHRAEPLGCRDGTIRWNQHHRGAMQGESWQWWPRRIVPRQWTTRRWLL